MPQTLTATSAASYPALYQPFHRQQESTAQSDDQAVRFRPAQGYGAEELKLDQSRFETFKSQYLADTGKLKAAAEKYCGSQASQHSQRIEDLERNLFVEQGNPTFYAGKLDTAYSTLRDNIHEIDTLLDSPNISDNKKELILDQFLTTINACADGVTANSQIALTALYLETSGAAGELQRLREGLVQSLAAEFATKHHDDLSSDWEIHLVNAYTNHVAEKFGVEVQPDEYDVAFAVTPELKDEFEQLVETRLSPARIVEHLAEEHDLELKQALNALSIPTSGIVKLEQLDSPETRENIFGSIDNGVLKKLATLTGKESYSLQQFGDMDEWQMEHVDFTNSRFYVAKEIAEGIKTANTPDGNSSQSVEPDTDVALSPSGELHLKGHTGLFYWVENAEADTIEPVKPEHIATLDLSTFGEEGLEIARTAITNATSYAEVDSYLTSQIAATKDAASPLTLEGLLYTQQDSELPTKLVGVILERANSDPRFKQELIDQLGQPNTTDKFQLFAAAAQDSDISFAALKGLSSEVDLTRLNDASYVGSLSADQLEIVKQNSKFIDLNGALASAFQDGSKDVVQTLLGIGAEFDVNNIQLQYGILNAAASDDIELIQMLPDDPEMFQIADQDSNGSNLLHVACYYDSPKVAQHLLAKYPSEIRSQNSSGHTPMIMAIQSGSADLIQTMLDADRHILFPLSSSETNPVDYARRNASPEVRSIISQAQLSYYRSLTEQGFDPSAIPTSAKGDLMKLSMHLGFDMAKELLATRSPALALDTSELLHNATSMLESEINKGNDEQAQLMISKYPELQTNRFDGEATLIHLAVQKLSPETLSWMLDQPELRAQISQVNGQGLTPLQIAEQDGKFAQATILRQASAA
ncbi:ankyrin repeat domain-containing protein [Pseudovibrio denitrificans]|uniref:ankyrin repeat domain-containing protein n=1 Tax=Pseudovibrio denitrificans TaxID=258256 RepID=UPI0039BF0F4C